MASKRATVPAKHLFNGFKLSQPQPRQTPTQCLVRTMATEISLPNTTLSQTYANAHLNSTPTEPILEDRAPITIPPPTSRNLRIAHPPPDQQQPTNPFLTTTQCTLHTFPSMEPTRLITYPSTHLLVPLRKDILHRAVIFEGDATRSGTANTKWRDEVVGSGRKIRPQKGTGKARLGDKKSPMLRGGGVAFGPKPRDFSTELPVKIYDLAWRTALSHRYRRGELIVLESTAEIDRDAISEASRARWLKDMLRYNHFGHADGRTLFVTKTKRPALFAALKDEGMKMGREAAAKHCGDVDVKDLLELGRLVVERRALESMFRSHQSDLAPERKFFHAHRE